jgi:crotonobetaine/carnitine-CoA ligase
MIEGYGMSEAPGVLSIPWEGPHKAGSMGKPSRHPFPGLKLAEAVVFDVAGNPAPVGMVGELAVRTPMLMQGYFGEESPEAAAQFRDGWFLTGDLARQDADGFFWFVARKKDIIRRRGENISGAELDRVLSAHPGVHEAAAIAVPSELGEDDILVAVVCRPGHALAPEEIGAWCKGHLPSWKVPRYVVFLNDLPHTPTHRVAKHRLREMQLAMCAIDLQLA